jgi:hypothetical protein
VFCLLSSCYCSFAHMPEWHDKTTPNARCFGIRLSMTKLRVVAFLALHPNPLDISSQSAIFGILYTSKKATSVCLCVESCD